MHEVSVGVPGALWDVTAAQATTGTSAAAVSASHAPSPSATRKVAVTHFSGSSDKSFIATIECPAGTVRWQKNFQETPLSTGPVNHFSENFDPPLVYQITAGAVLFKLASFDATNKSAVNGAGFDVLSG
jgi:hypothetical protein